jgi:hypothetical protein
MLLYYYYYYYCAGIKAKNQLQRDHWNIITIWK